jgi:hypothetical protein
VAHRCVEPKTAMAWGDETLGGRSGVSYPWEEGLEVRTWLRLSVLACDACICSFGEDPLAVWRRGR